MKTQLIRNFVLAFGLLGASGFGGLYAQSRNLNANVPFTFRVQDQVLASGSYRVAENTVNQTALITNRETRKSIMCALPMSNSEKTASPRLIFHKYGETYFLAEVWDGTGSGYKVPASKLEKEMLRNGPTMAGLTGMQVVTINAD